MHCWWWCMVPFWRVFFAFLSLLIPHPQRWRGIGINHTFNWILWPKLMKPHSNFCPTLPRVTHSDRQTAKLTKKILCSPSNCRCTCVQELAHTQKKTLLPSFMEPSPPPLRPQNHALKVFGFVTNVPWHGDQQSPAHIHTHTKNASREGYAEPFSAGNVISFLRLGAKILSASFPRSRDGWWCRFCGLINHPSACGRLSDAWRAKIICRPSFERKRHFGFVRTDPPYPPVASRYTNGYCCFKRHAHPSLQCCGRTWAWNEKRSPS